MGQKCASSLALSGGVCVVGVPVAGGTSETADASELLAAREHVLVYGLVGRDWLLQSILLAPTEPGALFGSRVSTDGASVVVGAMHAGSRRSVEPRDAHLRD